MATEEVNDGAAVDVVEPGGDAVEPGGDAGVEVVVERAAPAPPLAGLAAGAQPAATASAHAATATVTLRPAISPVNRWR